MPELNDNQSIRDDVNIELEKNTSRLSSKVYEVVSEAGLFKNGSHYPTGSEIALSEDAAKNFLSIGDIKAKEAK